LIEAYLKENKLLALSYYITLIKILKDFKKRLSKAY